MSYDGSAIMIACHVFDRGGLHLRCVSAAAWASFNHTSLGRRPPSKLDCEDAKFSARLCDTQPPATQLELFLGILSCFSLCLLVESAQQLSIECGAPTHFCLPHHTRSPCIPPQSSAAGGISYS